MSAGRSNANLACQFRSSFENKERGHFNLDAIPLGGGKQKKGALLLNGGTHPEKRKH